MPGGVCAVLDYEVELMSDYVSEMATRIVLPQKNVNSAFRKFVSQILSSTRLPSTTILLGMNYLAKRINMMHVVGHTHHTEGQVWRMVTVALLLGSKFLDDNTFQNKSWSEVSGIPVQELNTLEHEWLGANNWCLYVNLDESKDYNAWLANWKEWLETRQSQQAQAARGRMASLSPIDTEVGRPRKALIYSSWHQQQVAEYERLSNMKRNSASVIGYSRDQSWLYANGPWPAGPVTPPDSGYGTPEYPNSATSTNSHYKDWFDRAVGGNSTVQRPYHPSAQFNPFHAAPHPARHMPSYQAFYPYSHSIWEPPSAECNCGSCAGVYQKHPAHLVGNGFGQPVVG